MAISIGMGQSLLVRTGRSRASTEALPFVIVALMMIIGGTLIPARGTLSLARLPLAPATRFRAGRFGAGIAIVVLALVLLDSTYQSRDLGLARSR